MENYGETTENVLRWPMEAVQLNQKINQKLSNEIYLYRSLGQEITPWAKTPEI